ncbi:MAG: hypothetical protein JNM57_10150 [Cyclobacteriaceae bacterium]|nr:hypothetical protein [Cyclobacteriaceae bacterium]
MKNLITTFSLLLVAGFCLAQNFEKEINTQVWKPFIDAYSKFDTEKFMALHSTNVIRVSQDEKKIFNFTDYKKNIARENQFNKNYNIKANIELRFQERIHSEILAYETGFFKISVIENTGKNATVYGKFQVTLQKEKGTWKILVDSDTSEGGSVTEKDFLSAKSME